MEPSSGMNPIEQVAHMLGMTVSEFLLIRVRVDGRTRSLASLVAESMHEAHDPRFRGLSS